MRAERCAAVLLLPALLLTGCAGRPAFFSAAAPTATPTPTPTTSSRVVHGTGVARPFDRYELQDLRRYAESSGEPLTQVLASQRGAAEFGTLANALEAEAGSGMVMAGRDREAPGTAYMSFTDRPDAPTMARLTALPLDTTVTWGLPLPHGELVRYSESLAGALDGVPGVRFLECGPTPLGDAVRLRYALTGPAPSKDVLDAAVLKATERWSVDGSLRVPVRLSVGPLDERIKNLTVPNRAEDD